MRLCGEKDMEGLLSFYTRVCRETGTMAREGRWVFGLYPTREMIEDYVRRGMMVVLEEGEEAAAAVQEKCIIPQV